MFLYCESNNNWDKFYLPNIDDMDELKQYVKNNMPIDAYLLGNRHKGTIYNKEDCNFVHLYLNNYLHYRSIYGYFSDEETIENIEKTCNCNNCTKNDGWHCVYVKTDSGCKYFKEKPIGLLKKLFNRN